MVQFDRLPVVRGGPGGRIVEDLGLDVIECSIEIHGDGVLVNEALDSGFYTENRW